MSKLTDKDFNELRTLYDKRLVKYRLAKPGTRNAAKAYRELWNVVVALMIVGYPEHEER